MNKMHGKGKYNWPSGMHYIGEYKEDLKDGYGEFFWPSGDSYRGCWL